MTRRSEDSGLIDLDALMREAAAREASGEPPARVPAVATAPTPAPSTARTAVPIEAPDQASPKATRPTLRPPAKIALERDSSAPPAHRTPRSPAAEVSSAVTPEPPVVAKTIASENVVPPAPSTKPSRRADDSLEAVTSAPTTDPWIATASPSVPPPTKPSPGAGRGRRRTIGIALGLALLAGGAVLLRTRNTAVAPPIATAAPIVAPAQIDRPKAPPVPAAEAPTAAPLSADDLPAAVTSVAAPPPSARSTRPSAAERSADGPKGAATLTEAALPPSSSAERGDLGDAMRGAVGTRDQTGAVSNDGTSSSTASQLRPSPGAVVGALGSVLPTARACLGPDDPVRSGLVVFKSDGTVARVDLRGSKPEDDCVRSALSKAKVAPFVDETFSTRVTVRP